MHIWDNLVWSKIGGKRFNTQLVEAIRTKFRGNQVEHIITISVLKSQKKDGDGEVNFSL